MKENGRILPFIDKEQKKSERNLRHRLILKYTLLATVLFFTGSLTVLFLLALEKNYIDGADDITTLITESIYMVLMLFIAIILLFFTFKLFIYEVAYRDAEDITKDQKITVKDEGGMPLFVANSRAQIEALSSSTTSLLTRKNHLSAIPGKTATSALIKKGASRFPTLASIDKEHPYLSRVQCDPELTLASFCDNLRGYMAGDLRLYYSPKDVRTFVSSLCTSRIILLQGMSGTGKTSLPVAFGKFISETTSVIPVQPTWKERSDLLGYYNEFTGKFSETPLLSTLYEAGTTDSVRLVVLDEVNIARIEYYFAEFLSLLELPDENARILPVAPSGMPNDPKRMINGAMLLPENVWFVGTANNDDSTFAISDKVYDRASVMDLDTRAEPFHAEGYEKKQLSLQRLNRLNAEAQRRYALTERDLRKIGELDSFLRSTFRVSFGNRILRQMKTFVPAYVACGGKAEEALDLILAKKVLRKLSSCNPVLVKARSKELTEKINSLFGEGNAEECLFAIRKLAENG